VSPNLQLYVGTSAESIKLPNHAAAEVDFWGGIRPTFGPVSFDFGFWYYSYPGGEGFYTAGWLPPYPGTVGVVATNSNISFYEGYGKVTWAITPNVSVGANVNYSPSFLNTTAEGTYYSGVVKLTAPANLLPNGIGAYLSGEVGHQVLGTMDNGFNLPDWTTWNVGVGFTWKAFTLDLRYTDTDLSKTNCFTLTGDPGANLLATGAIESKWCNATFVAKLSANTTVFSLLK
jgi:uncharacterized protein (TIGR02001 family)